MWAHATLPQCRSGCIFLYTRVPRSNTKRGGAFFILYVVVNVVRLYLWLRSVSCVCFLVPPREREIDLAREKDSHKIKSPLFKLCYAKIQT